MATPQLHHPAGYHLLSLANAPVKIEAWRRDYNESRAYTALGWLTPAEYAVYAGLPPANAGWKFVFCSDQNRETVNWVSILQDVDLTQCAGLTSFSIAAISHLRTGRQSADINHLTRPWWFGLSAVYALLCIELVANTRHTLLRMIGASIGLGYHYDARRPAQVAMLVLLAILITWLIAKAVPVIRRRPKIRWALMLGLCSANLFIIEVISLHQLDAVFYAKIGPVMLIGWAWLVLGIIAAAIAFASTHPASAPAPVRH